MPQRFRLHLALVPSVLLTIAATHAQVTNTQVFDLCDTSASLFSPPQLTNLASPNDMQSFGFDDSNKFLYVVQVGKFGSDPYHTSVSHGDLKVTQLTVSGERRGSMSLSHFGHGVSVGVEPSGTNTYLWMEVDPHLPQAVAYGNTLARFKFVDGAVYTTNSPEITRFYPVAGARLTTCSIDMEHGYLTYRYHATNDSRFHFAVFDLEAVKSRTNHFNGRNQPLVDIVQPELAWTNLTFTHWSLSHWSTTATWTTNLASTFQGYTSWGSYLYLLEGEKYGTVHVVTNYCPLDHAAVSQSITVHSPGNTYITAVDLNTGDANRMLTKAGYRRLNRREPEGMAVQTQVPISGGSYSNSPRLCFGFSITNAISARREAALYYKDERVDILGSSNGLGDDADWANLPWIGDFAPLSYDWIYHSQHGYMYLAPHDSPEGIYFYTLDMGWLWTGSTIYPYAYRFADGVWLWYLMDSSFPRWFYNCTTMDWESH